MNLVESSFFIIELNTCEPVAQIDVVCVGISRTSTLDAYLKAGHHGEGHKGNQREEKDDRGEVLAAAEIIVGLPMVLDEFHELWKGLVDVGDEKHDEKDTNDEKAHAGSRAIGPARQTLAADVALGGEHDKTHES